MSVTALDLITGAFDALGVYAPGESIPAPDSADALRRLNGMVSGWMVQPLTIPVTVRKVYALTSGKGGPGNEYTIGPGGDFNQIRPANGLSNVGLSMPGATPYPIEIPRALLTDDAWALIQVKDLQSPMFTAVYYNPTYTSDLGSINLWPVPDTTDYSLVVYYASQIAEFADLTTSYVFPPGYQEALEYNLALRLAAPYGKPLGQDIVVLATKALATIKRANTKLTDLAVDPAITKTAKYSYNIQTGTGS